ncbi:MAG: T9SS type A sorting domain-containing protein [Bacteroidetes bacterium]|nr:T9SS type A sorting domain-containing protein [Bacteroidota bacterium]
MSDENEPILVSENRLFRICPNPTKSRFTVELLIENQHPMAEVKVFGMMGKLLIGEQLSGVKKTELSLENLPAGIYLL